MSVQIWLTGSWNRPALGLLAAALGFLFGFRALPAAIGRMSGWSELTRQFSFEGSFHGARWRFQSARMRNWVAYNNCLTVGANAEGLYIKAPSVLVAYPPLFVPWREISVSRTRILFQPMARLQLGHELSVPFTIREGLAARLRQAAGNSWPVESIE